MMLQNMEDSTWRNKNIFFGELMSQSVLGQLCDKIIF